MVTGTLTAAHLGRYTLFSRVEHNSPLLPLIYVCGLFSILLLLKTQGWRPARVLFGLVKVDSLASGDAFIGLLYIGNVLSQH